MAFLPPVCNLFEFSILRVYISNHLGDQADSIALVYSDTTKASVDGDTHKTELWEKCSSALKKKIDSLPSVIFKLH